MKEYYFHTLNIEFQRYVSIQRYISRYVSLCFKRIFFKDVYLDRYVSISTCISTMSLHPLYFSYLFPPLNFVV